MKSLWGRLKCCGSYQIVDAVLNRSKWTGVYSSRWEDEKRFWFLTAIGHTHTYGKMNFLPIQNTEQNAHAKCRCRYMYVVLCAMWSSQYLFSLSDRWSAIVYWTDDWLQWEHWHNPAYGNHLFVHILYAWYCCRIHWTQTPERSIDRANDIVRKEYNVLKSTCFSHVNVKSAYNVD